MRSKLKDIDWIHVEAIVRFILVIIIGALGFGAFHNTEYAKASCYLIVFSWLTDSSLNRNRDG